MSAVARAIAAAAKAAHRVAGVDVVYKRGAEEIPVKAAPGSTSYLATDASGVTIVCHARDYLIIAAELLLDDEPLEPQDGDVIVETLADGEHTFQVNPLPSEPCWRWSDPSHVRRRIHTKETDHP